MALPTVKTNCKDTARSWNIVLGLFWLMFIETGVVKCFGVLLPDIRDQFQTKTWVIGGAVALMPGVGSVICILMGAASNVVQLRWITALCGLICASGLVFTSLATNVYFLIIALLLTDFASGTTVAMGSLSHYFDKHYNTAITIATCGLSTGIIVMPLLTQFLLDVYGWRGTILIIGGFSFHSVACSMLFKAEKSDYELVSPMEDSKAEKTMLYCTMLY